MDVFQRAPVTDQHAAKVSRNTLLAVVWSLCGLAICLVIARIYIRTRYYKHLFGDDYFALLALAILIGNATITHLMSGPMYDILLVSTGAMEPPPAFKENSSFYLKCQFASTILFWSCLWAVKGCFLAFFRRLTSQLKWPRRFWYAIVVVTILAYVGSIISYPLACSSFVLGQCRTTGNVTRSLFSLRFSTGVDILTDLMIICLPVYLTINVKLSLKQKLSLIAVLCLGVVVAVFSVIRIVFTNTIGRQPEISWLALWSSIESSIAVMVACLASFKILLTQRRAQTYSGLSGDNKARAQRGYTHSGSSQPIPKYGHTVVSVRSAPDGDTELPEMPRFKAGGDITVTRTVTVSNIPPSTNDLRGKRMVADNESEERILQ